MVGRYFNIYCKWISKVSEAESERAALQRRLYYHAEKRSYEEVNISDF